MESIQVRIGLRSVSRNVFFGAARELAIRRGARSMADKLLISEMISEMISDITD